MWRSAEDESSESFQRWLDRLARPIAFATRDAGACLPIIKNLDSFVTDQVSRTLSRQSYPRAVEASLLKLREIFDTEHRKLSTADQQRRLCEAAAIVQTLRAMHHRDSAAEVPIAPTAPSGGGGGLRGALWSVPIRFVKGVGPKRTSLLQRFGIETVEQALWTIPWRYEDRSVITPIGQLAPGMDASICGIIVRSEARRARHRRLSILDIFVEDRTGRMQAVFFNQPFLEPVLAVGVTVLLTGRVVAGARGWVDTRMDVSQYEVVGSDVEAPVHVGRIVPIYHETKGWTSRQMRLLTKGLLDAYAAGMQDILPTAMRARYRLPPIDQAVEEVHFPRPGTPLPALEQGRTPAHRRLAFEELLLLQLALAVRQGALKEERKPMRCDSKTALLGKLSRRIPFKLTAAQQRVIGDIVADMTSSRPMNRLVQGDVGCGKTMVALHAMVLACGSGYQAALMVPTEILAEQHYRALKHLLESVGLSVALISGGGRANERKAARERVASGSVQVAIGTHALIQQGVTFPKLALVVIDEQHRFGVLQRKTLAEKGYAPDVLVLTATPIPRTLAMTVYGDLDVSVIDQLPPGRRPVRTFLYQESQRRRAYQILKDEVRSGRQAYVVYPLVEESEKVDLQAAIQGADRLRTEELSEFHVAVLHGRMKSTDKDRTMEDFTKGKVQVLVSTTVVEVGVDVPNATVMLIEHAERFGLAQLHQLRGRVGRGEHQSYCLLMASGIPRGKGVLGQRGNAATLPRHSATPPSSSAAGERLEALVRSADGFVIAEEDLRIRGPGEFFGYRQWGVPEFRVANLIRDADLLQQARQEAFALLRNDRTLAAPAYRMLRDAMMRRWEKKLDLGSVS